MKVSVCIPTFNTGRYIGETIDSVLKQTFKDFELVVCDNASTDNTAEVCAKFTDSRFRRVYFEEFIGQAENWNRALSLATGEYVILLHSDDALLPAFLEQAVRVLDQNPDVGLVHCTTQHIDEEGKSVYLQRLYEEDFIDREEILLRKFLLEGCSVNPAGVLVRKSVYEAIGNFTDKIVWSVDPHMWTRVALKYPVAYLAEPLALYRVHAASLTTGVMKTARNGADELWMMEDIFRQIPADRADLKALHDTAIKQIAHRTWCYAEECCRRGDMQAARAGIQRAVSINHAMIFESRAAALWVASFLGYDWFEKMQKVKKKLGSA